MRKKIILTIILFISFIVFSIPKSNAQTLGELRRIAEEDIDKFLNMSIDKYAQGNTDSSIQGSKAAYCMDHLDSNVYGGNGKAMKTAVVDIGKDGIGSVNNLNTSNSVAAQRAMEVLYYATKSYQLDEPWGATQRSPYRMMMLYKSAYYSKTMTSAGLFSKELPDVSYDIALDKFGPGLSEKYMAEARKYVSSTANFSFEDKSEKNKQSIIEKDGLIFVGPYKIANTGAGSINDIVATNQNGKQYLADGWAKKTNKSAVKWNKDLPNGSFYLVFQKQKPDSIKNIKITKQVKNVMEARMVFCASDGGQNIAIYGGKTSSIKEYSITLPGIQNSTMTITKKDATTGNALKNIGFMIYNEDTKKWVKNGTPVQYVSKDQATVFKTNSKGQVTIKNLTRAGTYTIYEVQNPYFGYEQVSKNNPLKVAQTTISLGQNAKVAAKNQRKYIKLSGHVWENIIDGKTSNKNNTYDSADKDIQNMKVSLKDKNGNLLKNADGKEIQPKLTNSKGEYSFGDYSKNKGEKILIKDIIDGAYIEFEYNGMIYRSSKLTDGVNGSKATDEINRNKSGENNQYFYSTRYATVTDQGATDDEGRITKLDYNFDSSAHISILKYAKDTSKYVYGYKDQAFPIDGIDNQYKIMANTKDANKGIMGQNLTAKDIYELSEIQNINLGIEQREMPDLAISQDILNAKITLNDYEHTYNYAQRTFLDSQNKNPELDGFNVTVKFGTKYGSQSYTREIYSSDIIYNKTEEGKGKLGVYITYKIGIRNESTTVFSKVNEVTNYYDSRFEIIKTGDKIDDNGNIVSEIKNHEEIGYEKNGYKKSKIYTNSPKEVEPQKETYIYIQYKLDNDAVNAVLNQDVTLSSISEITSYSSFEDGFNKIYSGVDEDSRPNSITTDENRQSTYEDDTDEAPTLILKAKNPRQIAGTVWEDEAIDELTKKDGYDKQRLGNGIYDDKDNEKEKVVQNVKVELMTKENQVASLYNNEGEKKIEAVTYTNEDGYYHFDGIIPGEYYIRYTYGNESKIDGQPMQIQKYKSTIYRGGNKEDAESDNKYWYGEETSANKEALRLSDARDIKGIYSDQSDLNNKEEYTNIVNKRTTQEQIDYQYIQDENKLQSIEAESKNLDIKLEYDVNLDNISQYGTDLKFVFDNIDFGIIRRPIQELKITKQISYIEILLANGQTIVSGDPRDGYIRYLKILNDGKDGGPGTVYIEVDNEIIQGATLKVEYEIKVDATSCEVDFNDKDYYIYGIVPSNYKENGIWKMATVTDLYDYVSNDLIYDETLNDRQYGWITLSDAEIKKGEFSEKAYSTLKNYNKILHTDYFKDMNPEAREKSAILKLTRVLSNNEVDFTYDNDVEVHKLEGNPPDNSTPGNYDPSGSPNEPDEDKVTIIITGPTGGNRNYLIYGIIGIVILVIFTTGIILIKNFLKKNK